MQTVFLVVNKNWEVEPALNALTQAEFRPKPLPYPAQLSSPRREKTNYSVPRATYFLPTPDASRAALQVLVWCVQDWMDGSKSSSSSEEKFRVLPGLYQQYGQVDLVVAVGTAASFTTAESLNGSVLLGGRFFLHDARALDPNSASRLQLADFDRVLDGGAEAALFARLREYFQANATAHRLLPVVNLPGLPADWPAPGLPQVLVEPAGVALGTINVTNYDRYKDADAATVAAFNQTDTPAGLSVETTHGLIYLTAPRGTPVLFVSGIANRVLAYNEEATALHRYQAAFNAGVVLGDLMLALAESAAS